MNASLVLWQQPLEAPHLNQTRVITAMLPVARVDVHGVWYTRYWDQRLIMTAEEANDCFARIRRDYGGHTNVVILPESGWADSTEAKRDRFLPAWSYCIKHNLEMAT